MLFPFLLETLSPVLTGFQELGRGARAACVARGHGDRRPATQLGFAFTKPR